MKRRDLGLWLFQGLCLLLTCSLLPKPGFELGEVGPVSARQRLRYNSNSFAHKLEDALLKATKSSIESHPKSTVRGHYCGLLRTHGRVVTNWQDILLFWNTSWPRLGHPHGRSFVGVGERSWANGLFVMRRGVACCFHWPLRKRWRCPRLQNVLYLALFLVNSLCAYTPRAK